MTEMQHFNRHTFKTQNCKSPFDQNNKISLTYFELSFGADSISCFILRLFNIVDSREKNSAFFVIYCLII